MNHMLKKMRQKFAFILGSLHLRTDITMKQIKERQAGTGAGSRQGKMNVG
jgi:hypothetical protein